MKIIQALPTLWPPPGALAVFLAVALVDAMPAQAATRTWILAGVQFADGGTASGSIDTDTNTGEPVAWNISVAGGNTGSFPPVTFTAANSTYSQNFQGTASRMLFNMAGRHLRLSPQSSLAQPCGPIPLDLSVPDNNVECFNCSPYRLVTAGALDASTLEPECLGGTTLPPEFTVFGTGERSQLSNSVASSLVKLERRSLSTNFFNNANRFTYSVSLISSGTNIIAAGHPNGLYETYFYGRNDIKEMELMAETLIIRSPLFLRQTDVNIKVRHLRFEGSGKIITIPQELTVRAPDATAQQPVGGNGADSMPGGSLEVDVETYTDATGNSDLKFVLTGGKGQDAGRGKHGTDGTAVDCLYAAGETATYNITDPICPNTSDSYTPPLGWCVTRWRHRDGSISGVEAWPTDGTDAWAPGIPGQGGKGGSITGSRAAFIQTTTIFGGSAGAPGYPSPTNAHPRTDICEGGWAGTPVQSIHIYSWRSGTLCFTAHIDEDGRHTTTNGTTFPVPVASNGAIGGATLRGNTLYTWLHPQLLHKILSDAKDDYLQNRIAAAESRLQDYASFLEQYQADTSAWDAAPEMTRYELSQMYDEMRILLQQIANGLDYFGNPNGWVPMLSFEVTANLFDQEIDRSLDIIYLSQWISQKQADAAETLNALDTARTKLAAEIDVAKSDYDMAAANLAGLQGEADSINQRVQNLQLQLEAKYNELLGQAQQNTQPSQWEIGVRVGLKTAAAICEMVPVYQPALGAAGGALDLASNYDPDRPWDTLTGALDLTKEYAESGIQQAAEDQLLAKDGVNTGELSQSSKRIANLQNLSRASGALSHGIKNVSSYLEKTKAPSSKIEAELDRLKSSNPQYGALINDIRKLMQDKREFADKITEGIQKVASLSDLITRNILAIDGLSVQIGANANIIDARVDAYLKDMERRAFDRLLKYHYYMAKAYEYRMVRPYTGTLNLESLYNKMTEIANAGTNANSHGNLDAGQRNALKSVFKAVIADTTESIINDYSQNASSMGTSFTFDLTAGEIASLNRGEAITLNLVNRGFFLPTEENIRIADLRVFANAPGGIGTAGNYSSPSYIELLMEHSGISNVKLDGRVYQFRHYNQSTRNAITWKSRYEPVPNILSPGPLIEANDSLLRSLLPGLTSDQVLLYSRPSAWADLRIWRRGNNGTTTFDLGQSNAPITLTKVTLQVSFDRVDRTDTPTRRRNLEVMVAQVDDAQGTSPVVDTLAPFFVVSNPDPTGRQHGQGRFVRIYNYNSPASVQVTAQDLYGALGFYKWTENGADIGSDPTITLPTTADHRVTAQYVSLLPIPITISKTGNQAILSWQGGEGIRLQKRSCLLPGCVWEDVAGTDGQSSIAVSSSLANASYFRLVRIR
jgi:hypothetical protein